jgi:hypothetical protein
VGVSIFVKSLSLAIAILLTPIHCHLASGQDSMAFEVISVKPSQSGRSNWSESLCYGGGRFLSREAPILWEIKSGVSAE